ncbi:activator of 90 kDa heat shock protein ATPase homolog 1-like [Orbicella faveolata]|uniref:activator of 90 kDa heat shock protein ATPase homolog 1-like n=1 Tax=Orbicella faveolata TaxID=48498 RepID=UPI0009E4CD5A|nr:activator of 90 kDa heat shock protein ATPase homolog 1-like [Orbicella faveolata]
MAKWGEGDPRWIVEERADAKNVNNWHWTEKNATPWSKERLKTLLKDLEIETDKGKVKITDVRKIDGEAYANNRKAKLIFFYEWVITLDWSGTITDSDKVWKGNIEIPNLSEEHDVGEVNVLVTTEKSSDESYQLKEMVRSVGPELIREKLSQYIKELRQEFSQGMILPSKDSPVLQRSSSEALKAAVVNASADSGDANKNKTDTAQVGCPISTKKLTMTQEFLTTAEELYAALTEQQRIEAFTQSSAKVDASRGGTFVLFNGNVTGKFQELVSEEKIVMQWRYKSWPEGHHSKVTISLDQKDDRTELKLIQTGIPEEDFERTKEGWKQFYWGNMKQTFCWGMRYF